MLFSDILNNMETIIYILKESVQILIILLLLFLFSGKRSFYGFNDKTQVS